MTRLLSCAAGLALSLSILGGAAPAVAAVPDTTLVATGPSQSTYGFRITLVATLRRADDASPLSGQGVKVYRRQYGESAFAAVADLTTGSDGKVVYRPTPAKRTDWYFQHSDTTTLGASQSATLTTVVVPRLGLRIPLPVVEQGQASPVTVSVAPSHAGQWVHIRELVNGSWVDRGHATLSNSSQATFPVASATVATRRYRVDKAADGDHGWTATPTFTITTIKRTIRSGYRGADVTDVQRRLIGLHYDIPSADGTFGFDSVHAAAAFQKAQGLPITGAVDRGTYARLLKPVAPKLRFVQSGNWIEIDVTKQVLYFGRGGAVFRILDVSTGSGQWFTVEGETQRAVTPLGNFSVQYKLDKMQKSRLGYLWRPAYFASGGYAIHGNDSVPFYPASHGCVRITNPAMNRMFSMLYRGLPVYVYRS